MTYINEMVDGKLYTINKDTGEVIYPEPIKLPQRRLSGKYAGLNTKYPSECENKHQLIEAVKAIDPHWNHPVEFDSEWVMRTAEEGGMSLNHHTLKLLFFLKDSVSAWNVVFTNTKEMNKVVDRRRVKKILEELQYAGILWHLEQDGSKYKIKMNAMVVWKGGYDFKENAIRSHYSPKCPKSGHLPLCTPHES